MKNHLNLIIAALLAFSLPASGQTLTLSTPADVTMTMAAPVEATMTMAVEPPPPPARPARTIADWNALLRGHEGDIFRHVQNARDSNSARFHLEADPTSDERLAFHSELLIERLLGCLAEALIETGREIYLTGSDDFVGPGLANSYAIRAVKFFGDQTSLAWEREIIAAVVRLSTLPPHDPGRLAGYEALKATFSPLEITARGAQPVLTIGDEMPRMMMSGVPVSEMSPSLDAPLVLEFRNFPPAFSESDGYLIRVDTPARKIIGGKEIEYTHNNEAIYEVERYSAESGEPNPISTAYVLMGRGESVSIALFEAMRDNPTLRPGDVRRTLIGIRTTITRTETAAPEDE